MGNGFDTPRFDDELNFAGAFLRSTMGSWREEAQRTLQGRELASLASSTHEGLEIKPLYTEDGKINGYQLGIEGEADFFHSVGIAENDIVRSVNSIDMTNRRRAEFFLHEFVNDRANAFVLEVERNGEVRKLIYQMR